MFDEMIAIDAGCTRKLKWKCSCLLEVALWVQNILLINVFTLNRLVFNSLTSRELVISFYSISPDSLIHHLYFLLTSYTKKINNSIVTNFIWNLYLQYPCGIEVKNIIFKCPRDSIVWWFFSVSIPSYKYMATWGCVDIYWSMSNTTVAFFSNYLFRETTDAPCFTSLFRVITVALSFTSLFRAAPLQSNKNSCVEEF